MAARSPGRLLDVLPELLLLLHLPPLDIHAQTAVRQEMRLMLRTERRASRDLAEAHGLALATCFLCSSSGSARGQRTLGELHWKLGSGASLECGLDSCNACPGG